MSEEVHHYDPAVYGEEHVHGENVAPVICSCTAGNRSAPLESGAVPPCCGCRYTRPPCCCEVFRESITAPHRQHLFHHRAHSQLQQGQEEEGEKENEQPPQQYRSSRRCFYCVPEQEELQECERLEKERRYRSMRAERQQLQTALYEGRSRGEIPRYASPWGLSYRTNTAHLLRYSQRPFYQRAVEKEQERRRQELRKEIEERKRLLNVRKPKYQLMFAPTPSRSGVHQKISFRRTRKEPFARGFTTVCPTSGLRQHKDPERTNQGTTIMAVTPPEDGDHSHFVARKHRRETRTQAKKGDTGPKTEVSARGVSRPAAGRTSTSLRDADEQKVCSVESSPHVGIDKCCCRRCRCCKCCCLVHPADVMATMRHKAEVVPRTTEKKETKEPVAPLQAATQTSGAASPSPRFHLTAVDHGRKIYITDDVYLSHRTKVIERLEQDGFVRLLPPTTRSPSAPLPEKSKKWTTTRSTSAHRVCV